MRFQHLCLLCVCFTLTAGSAGLADFLMGPFARQAAMGGAGLALIDQPGSAQYTNPAALAHSRAKWGFNFPSMSLRYEGTDFSTARDLRSEAVDLSGDDVAELALTLAETESVIDVHTVTGVTMLRQNVGIEVQGRARVEPDAALQLWAQDPDANPLTGASSLVSAAAVASVPSIAIGGYIPGYSKGRLAVGARVRFQQISGRIQRVNFIDEAGSSSITDIVTEDKNGVAADIGLLYEPADMPGMSLALVVDNVVHPDFNSFDQDLMLSIGGAQRLPGGFTIAADAVNLTNAYGDGTELRGGVEFKPFSFFAARAGKSSRKGLTWGVQLAGFNFAWSGDSPLIVSQSLRF